MFIVIKLLLILDDGLGHCSIISKYKNYNAGVSQLFIFLHFRVLWSLKGFMSGEVTRLTPPSLCLQLPLSAPPLAPVRAQIENSSFLIPRRLNSLHSHNYLRHSYFRLLSFSCFLLSSPPRVILSSVALVLFFFFHPPFFSIPMDVCVCVPFYAVQ